MNISTNPLFRKISFNAVLNPMLEIRGETAKSILSYALAGPISNRTVRNRVMMENAENAEQHANAEYHSQFNEMVVSYLYPALREKYDLMQYKKALLSTGKKTLLYFRDNERQHDIEEMLSRIRSIIREQEKKKHTAGGRVEYRYQLTHLVYRVYQTLKTLIQNGTENLSRFTGKTLRDIAGMLVISSIPLTGAQQKVVTMLGNVGMTQNDGGKWLGLQTRDGKNWVNVTYDRLSSSTPLRLVQNIAQTATMNYERRGGDAPVAQFNTKFVLPENVSSVDSISKLGLSLFSQYTFLLDMPVTYKKYGNDVEMPAGTRLVCTVTGFAQRADGTPYLMVLGNRAEGPDGKQFDLPTKEINVNVSRDLKLVQKDGHVKQYQPFEWKTETVQIRPEMGVFNIFVSPDFVDDVQDMMDIVNMEDVDSNVSIIPFWLQIRYADNYNNHGVDEKQALNHICNAFATCVLNEKGFPYQTVDEKAEFHRQKNEFCDSATPAVMAQIQKLWQEGKSPFSNLSENQLQAIQNTLFNHPLRTQLPSLATSKQIKEWFHQMNPVPFNSVTVSDIQNEEGGEIMIKDSDLDDVHSCNYGGGHSVSNFVAKSIVAETWSKIKRDEIRAMMRHGMKEDEARKNMREKYVKEFQKLSTMGEATRMYQDYVSAIVSKRLRSALTNIYDPKNTVYTKLHRLLVTTYPNDLVDEKFQKLMYDLQDHRDVLIKNGVEGYSVEELEKLDAPAVVFSPSLDDREWLHTQLEDLVLALKSFLTYVRNKGESAPSTQIRHTKFIVNLYAKCFDSISDEIGVSMDDLPEIPEDFRKRFKGMGSDSERYMWTYLMSLYKAREHLRRKLAAKNLKMESTDTINRVTLKLAENFIEGLVKMDPMYSSSPDHGFFILAGLSFSNIISHLHRYWKGSKMLDQHEFDFAYQILSRQKAQKVLPIVNNKDQKIKKDVKNMVTRFTGWSNADEISETIVERLYEMMFDLHHNHGASIKTRLYYFASSLDSPKDEEVVNDMEEDEVVENELEEEEDDDQPNEGRDYDDLFGDDDEEDGDDDLFGGDDVGDDE